jgi:large subunit ribosomal protein L7/L12
MAKKKEKKEAKEKKSVAKIGNKKLDKMIDEISELSVLELSELVEALEDKFGVEAVAAAPAAVAPANGGQEEVEEKSEYDVILTSAGDKKINVIKALRTVKPDLGLKEAKDLTENTPAEILKGAKKEQAEEAKKKLEEAGGSVELK